MALLQWRPSSSFRFTAASFVLFCFVTRPLSGGGLARNIARHHQAVTNAALNRNDPGISHSRYAIFGHAVDDIIDMISRPVFAALVP